MTSPNNVIPPHTGHCCRKDKLIFHETSTWSYVPHDRKKLKCFSVVVVRDYTVECCHPCLKTDLLLLLHASLLSSNQRRGVRVLACALVQHPCARSTCTMPAMMWSFRRSTQSIDLSTLSELIVPTEMIGNPKRTTLILASLTTFAKYYYFFLETQTRYRSPQTWVKLWSKLIPQTIFVYSSRCHLSSHRCS